MSFPNPYPNQIPRVQPSSTTRGILNGDSTGSTSGSRTPATPFFEQQPRLRQGPSPYTSATYPLAPDQMSPVPFQGTVATESPALDQNTPLSTEYYYLSETSANGGRSALPPMPRPNRLYPSSIPDSNPQSPSSTNDNEQRNLILDRLFDCGLGLGLGQGRGQGQDRTQLQDDESLQQVPEGIILVEWVSNNRQLNAFKDSTGLFTAASYPSSSFDDGKNLSQPAVLSTTHINAESTMRDILERVEESRTIIVERAAVSPHRQTMSLVLKEMKVRFDIPGGRTGEVYLRRLSRQEMRELWKLVQLRGWKDVLVLEYDQTADPFEPSDKTSDEGAAAAATDLRDDDQQQGVHEGGCGVGEQQETERDEMGHNSRQESAGSATAHETGHNSRQKSAGSATAQKMNPPAIRKTGRARRRFQRWVAGWGN